MNIGIEKQIVETALDNLQKRADITGAWKDAAPNQRIDGTLKLKINGALLNLNAEVRTELRMHQLPQIIEMAQRHPPLMVITRHLFPKVKDELRDKGIAYLEGNGNIFLKTKELFVLINAHKPEPAPVEKANRAFGKTGLKVIFHFLLNEQFINLPYREIAALTEVAVGNINYIFTGLKEQGFLLKLNKKEFKLNNKKALLEKWMVAYPERLKPGLEVGRFRFLKNDDFLNWKKLPLQNGKTWWGGEPAGDLYTNYLKPAELTLYTMETKQEIIKHYRLIPDNAGNVIAFKKFWKYDEVNDNVVPPLLVYADLMNTNDRRCIETAQRIYDELLQNKL
jgi:hypothetical protein